jgi:hypothetical protein
MYGVISCLQLVGWGGFWPCVLRQKISRDLSREKFIFSSSEVSHLSVRGTSHWCLLSVCSAVNIFACTGPYFVVVLPKLSEDGETVHSNAPALPEFSSGSENNLIQLNFPLRHMNLNYTCSPHPTTKSPCSSEAGTAPEQSVWMESLA